MTKLNKANNDGTVSITIPKQQAKQMGWEPGQNVVLNMLDNCHVLISNADKIIERDGGVPQPIICIEQMVDQIDDFNKTIKESYKHMDAFYNVFGDDERTIASVFGNTTKKMIADMLDRIG